MLPICIWVAPVAESVRSTFVENTVLPLIVIFGLEGGVVSPGGGTGGLAVAGGLGVFDGVTDGGALSDGATADSDGILVGPVVGPGSLAGTTTIWPTGRTSDCDRPGLAAASA